MIRVDRRRVPRPEVLAPGGAAEAELKACRAFYRPRAGEPDDAAEGERKRSFKFKVYKHQTIKDALMRLFRGKCAYCESCFSATQPMDVEHWRPKSLYWWLAASWENLLPSCIDCNRARNQEVLGKKTDEKDRGKSKVGKSDLFPLEPGTPRAKIEGTESEEHPLLLNPCTEDPAEHLEFLPLTAFERPTAGSGKRRRRPMYALGVVRARQSVRQGGLKAQKSIDVYGLNRSGLVQARAERRLLITGKMFTVRALAQLLGELESERAEKRLIHLVEDLISHEMARLKRFLGAGQPFAGMAEQIIKPFVEKITGAVDGP